MRIRSFVILGVVLGVLYCFSLFYPMRWDATEDKRYSLSHQTRELLVHIDQPLFIECYLNARVNTSFHRLFKSVEDMCAEMDKYAHVRFKIQDVIDSIPTHLSPVLIHEKGKDGKLSQVPVYPYVKISYGKKSDYVPLLQNNRMLSGEENINSSIESLEYAVMEAMSRIINGVHDRLLFVEGHGELSAKDIYDWSETLKKYYFVDRGNISQDSFALCSYKAIIVVGGDRLYSEREKYIIDQYVMRGGRILWLIDGVRLSEDELVAKGSSPLISNDLGIEDMLFKYGVRVVSGLVEDMQCLTIPSDVSQKGQQANFQPMPYYAYPLLLTSFKSPITKGLSQVNAKFVSPVESVGEKDKVAKKILLASSTRSRVQMSPALFHVSLQEDPASFKYAYIPVAVSLEGNFNSCFAHRIPPTIVGLSEQKKRGEKSKQIVVGGSRIAKNFIVGGQIIPAGFDPYSKIQFGNKDFLVNCVHFLCDDMGLMELRNRVVKLRLLNDAAVATAYKKIETWCVLTPILAIGLIFMLASVIRKRKYCF